MSFWGRCTECGEENEIYCDGDLPHFCPDCRSIDTIIGVDDDE